MASTETVWRYDAATRTYAKTTVTVPDQPRPARSTPARGRAPRRGQPRADNSELSTTSPFAASSLAFTAYDQEYAGPLADTRTWVKPATIRTHRPTVVMPASSGRVTMTKRELRGDAR